MKHLSVRNWAVRGVLIALAVLSLVVAIPLVNTHFTSHANVTGSRWTIHGHLVPAVKNLKATGKADRAQALTLSIALDLRNQAALEQLIAAQNDPTSKLYHAYLTPEQFAAQFSPAQATVDAVTAWLRSQHLVVHSVSANRTLITVSGSVATVEAAFQTSLATYTVQGRKVYAPTVDPSVPASLTGMIVSVTGLDNVGVYKHAPIFKQQANGAKANANPHGGSGPGGGYIPTDLHTAYSVTSLTAINGTGQGQTVALFELDGYKASDVSTYFSTYSLTPTISTVLVDGASTIPGPGAIEVELDMDVVAALAPKVTERVYIGPNQWSGINDTYNRIATDNIAKVVSTSWGLCEAQTGTSELTTLDQIFAQMQAQGQAVFAASGDAGAYDCGTTALAADSPASDPRVVGVGGTNLQTGSGGSYISEAAWSCSSCTANNHPKGLGSGGGLSSFFSKPSYQSGPGVNNSYSNGKRELPDVAADADPNTGYSVYCSVSASGCSSGGNWYIVGGTSASAPLWAGIAADLNQYLSGNGVPVLGNALPTLYRLFNTSQVFAAYHDVTSGNNLHYPATSGYDLATGIGTPNAWNMARDLAPILNGGFGAGSFTFWTTTGTTAVSTAAHSGTYAARVGSTGLYTGTSSIRQTVTVPSSASSLRFWYKLVCSKFNAYDTASAMLKDNTTGVSTVILTHSCSTTSAWTPVAVSVAPGHSYTLTLSENSRNIGGITDYALYDDVVVS